MMHNRDDSKQEFFFIPSYAQYMLVYVNGGQIE